jgi:hypothetical protein
MVDFSFSNLLEYASIIVHIVQRENTDMAAGFTHSSIKLRINKQFNKTKAVKAAQGR